MVYHLSGCNTFFKSEAFIWYCTPKGKKSRIHDTEVGMSPFTFTNTVSDSLRFFFYPPYNSGFFRDTARVLVWLQVKALWAQGQAGRNRNQHTMRGNWPWSAGDTPALTQWKLGGIICVTQVIYLGAFWYTIFPLSLWINMWCNPKLRKAWLSSVLSLNYKATKTWTGDSWRLKELRMDSGEGRGVPRLVIDWNDWSCSLFY